MADYNSDGSNKAALMRTTNGTKATIVASFASWTELTQINAIGNGSVLALGLLGGSSPRVVQFTSSSPVTILSPGVPVDAKAAAALSQASVPKGVNLSGAILRTSGDTLLRSSPSGVTVLLKPGDALPTGTLTTFGSLATNRLGDAAFTAQHGPKQGLYVYQNGRIQMIAEQDDQITGIAQITGLVLWSDTQIAMNNRGHVAVRTYTSGGEILCLFTQNAASARVVARLNGAIPGSSANLTGMQQVAIDENDRVAFIRSLNNGKRDCLSGIKAL